MHVHVHLFSNSVFREPRNNEIPEAISTSHTLVPRTCFLNTIFYQREPEVTGEVGEPMADRQTAIYAWNSLGQKARNY